jgi:8-oxo-dGTP diphosphatase
MMVAGKTIEAAGGIVVRKGARALVAVVQRAKDDAWVLPRGKLKRDENPVAGARREVVEETGHRVSVHEYVGAITYRAGGRPKVVQFWRMEADKQPSHELMRDIIAVEWLPLKAAIRRLSYPLEKLFLRHAAARAIPKHKRGKGKAKAHPAGKPVPKKSSAAARHNKPAKLKPAKQNNKNKPGKKNKRAL